MPRLSVIMPVYNAERYLSDALDSVVRQTYRDWELVAVDDGSTDRSHKILLEYAAKYSNIKVVQQANSGPGGAARRACAEAQGELLARVDADDINEPSRFEASVRFLDSHSDVAVVGTCAHVIDEHGRTTGDYDVAGGHGTIASGLLRRASPVANPTVTMRHAVYEACGGYARAATIADDYDLWTRLVFHGRMHNVSERLVRYRVHSGSVSVAAREKQFEVVARSFRVFASRLIDAPADPELCRDFLDMQRGDAVFSRARIEALLEFLWELWDGLRDHDVLQHRDFAEAYKRFTFYALTASECTEKNRHTIRYMTRRLAQKVMRIGGPESPAR